MPAGGPIEKTDTDGLADLSFMDEFSNIEALLQIVQPGMEGGNAFADIVSGAATPSGKLTDSCADEKVVIETETANVGNTYSGKEVVQIYVTCTEILFADVILSIILRIRFFPEKWLRL